MEQLLSLLRCPHVHVADESKVVEKVRAMAADGGTDRLLVVSDFDMTLTKYYLNGKRGCTSYGVIEMSSLMPDEYREKALKVHSTYAPIESSNHISVEERSKAMENWWEASHNLLVKYRFRKDFMKSMVAEANIDFRSKCAEMFTLLEERGIPLIIFSAGLADTINETLHQRSFMKSNMHIISNQILVDAEGVACGFSHPVIHSLNKGQSTAQLPADVMEEAKKRGNIILIGDSLGDPKMDSGLPVAHRVLRIGFLNHNEEELLPVYLQLYDIVLTQDSSMEVALAAITAVIGV